MANKFANYTTSFNSDIHPHKPFLHERLTITDLLLKLRKLRLVSENDPSCSINYALVFIGSETAETKLRLDRKQVKEELMKICSLIINKYHAKLLALISPNFGPTQDENTFENIKTINLAMRECASQHILRKNIRYISVLHHDSTNFVMTRNTRM